MTIPSCNNCSFNRYCISHGIGYNSKTCITLKPYIKINKVKTYKDLEFKSTKFNPYLKMLVQEIEKENTAQIEKWGIQNVTIFEWLCFTYEEMGETVKAIMEYEYRNGSKSEIFKEGIQTITLLAKILEMYNMED